MSFQEIQFSTDISYGAIGGPVFSTDIITTSSGYEQRNIRWSNARAKYNIATGIKTEEQWQELIAFFRARKGKAIGFRFKDWSDYKGINETIGIGDNIKTDFQLVKNYNSNITVSRNITKPVTGTVKIYIDSILQISGVNIDTTTGIVTFSTPPSIDSIITADFEFDVPVRFDTDEMAMSMDSFNAGKWNNIPLIEIRI